MELKTIKLNEKHINHLFLVFDMAEKEYNRRVEENSICSEDIDELRDKRQILDNLRQLIELQAQGHKL